MRLILLLLSLAIISCSRTEIPFDSGDECMEEVTYSNQVKPILDNSCAYSGCHVSGFPNGDFSNYESMEPFLTPTLFSKRVIELQDMPPLYAPEGRPKSLTSEELELINCWRANEFKN